MARCYSSIAINLVSRRRVEATGLHVCERAEPLLGQGEVSQLEAHPRRAVASVRDAQGTGWPHLRNSGDVPDGGHRARPRLKEKARGACPNTRAPAST